MNKKTYRRFDPWRPAPVREQSREQLIDGHYFTVERVSLSSSTSSRFDRLILRENREGDRGHLVDRMGDRQRAALHRHPLVGVVGEHLPDDAFYYGSK